MSKVVPSLASIVTIQNNMEQYLETYDNYVKVTFKLKFFNSCKASKIVPKGLVVEKNLATHVNDELFVADYQESLSEASSRSFDKIVEQTEYSSSTHVKQAKLCLRVWLLRRT